MSKELSPAFQFYPRDWLSDPNIASMSYEQEGWYIHLVCYCWMEGRIPASPAQALRLLGIRERDIAGCNESDLLSRFNKRHEDMEELLEMCFVPEAQLKNNQGQLEGEVEYLVHSRIERERKAQIERRKEREESGRRGGKASIKKRLQNPRSAWKQLQANTQANSTSSSSSSSSSSSDIKPPLPPKGNGGDPLFGFEQFYKAYPRHEAPTPARKAWAKIHANQSMLDSILSWIESAKLSEQWSDLSHVPLPATWINQRRWEGNPPPPPVKQETMWDRIERENADGE